MTYATTFSGIGGWELGLNACGWELKWQCERDEYCRALLSERFGAPIYPDIRTICDENPSSVDALIGSPPCQPFSVAGSQGGVADERHLYPAFIALVRHLEPRWVLMEQVPNILSLDDGRAFGGYLGGLVALGYDCVWHCIPACAVGAPHERDRLWIVAHSGCEGRKRHFKFNGLSRVSATPLAFPFNQGSNDRDWLEKNSGFIRERDGVSVGMVRREVEALGNAVIPQIPFLIGQAINEIESNVTPGLPLG